MKLTCNRPRAGLFAANLGESQSLNSSSSAARTQLALRSPPTIACNGFSADAQILQHHRPHRKRRRLGPENIVKLTTYATAPIPPASQRTARQPIFGDIAQAATMLFVPLLLCSTDGQQIRLQADTSGCESVLSLCFSVILPKYTEGCEPVRILKW